MTTSAHFAMSLDGFTAGPGQSFADPLGAGGPRLHDWRWSVDEPGHEGDAGAHERILRRRGAVVMGRNMFGPVRGPWDSTWAGADRGADGWSWNGWWGDEPPYHAPVFVLTHHQREPVEMAGGTTFHFVTDGFDSAYRQAVAASDDGDVLVAGGASTVRQALAAGVVDEVEVHLAPVILGGGERVFDSLAGVVFEPVAAVHGPLATHIRYRVGSR